MNFDIRRVIAPQSNGGEVVRDEVAAYIRRSLTKRLNAEIGIRFFQEESVFSGLGRLDRDYLRIDPALNWRLAPRWTLSARYTYTLNDETGLQSANADAENHRVYAGITYRGLGIGRR